MSRLAHVALLVGDYDEAIEWYVGRLGFTLVEDVAQPEAGKRWVTIRPPSAHADATTILLARAATPEQARAVGTQAGGRVWLSLVTDDFARDHLRLTAAGVDWVRPPATHAYGTVDVFRDNLWDLIEHAR